MTDAKAPVTADSGSAQLTADFPLPETGWSSVSNRLLVRISGPGTDKFLQGQFSQHLDEVVTGYSPRAAAATPKGRAYCLTRMIRDGDDVLIDLQHDLADAILTQLRKYLMLFRGTSAETVKEGRVVGLFGTLVASSLAGDGLSKLNQPGDTVAVDAGFLIRVEPTADGLDRFELWHTGPGQTALNDADEHPEADWQASEIAAGIASLTEQTREAFVPQMLNWQHVGGVHFKKGCYTGQEVIARMHFLGQLKKSLFRCRLACAETPQPGASVQADGRSVGTVVNAVALANGTSELLAVLRHDAADKPLTVEGYPDVALDLLPLPYPVPEREKSPQTDT
ncbi:YgfZ/GcvT domain-containing protein [Marinobacter sediminum]|uniref:CAF17-like 4Fe-4S cluster assembly/insertion protein YgfZ n=1 Tax=Marinobacter sediminum TaxID=256323 RepID=UPI001939A2ED|nr:folate-binding protein YgfZ [Marinobacter sediminum]